MASVGTGRCVFICAILFYFSANVAGRALLQIGGHSSGYPVVGHSASGLYPTFPQLGSDLNAGHYDTQQVYHIVHTTPKKCGEGEKLIDGECKKEPKKEPKKEEISQAGQTDIYFICPSGHEYISGSCQPIHHQNPYQQYPHQNPYQQYPHQNPYEQHQPYQQYPYQQYQQPHYPTYPTYGGYDNTYG